MASALNVQQSVAVQFPAVTTRSEYGIGMGRLIGGMVFQSGGNGFYYHKPELQYLDDEGEGYLVAVRALDAALLNVADWLQQEEATDG